MWFQMNGLYSIYVVYNANVCMFTLIGIGGQCSVTTFLICIEQRKQQHTLGQYCGYNLVYD